MNEIYRSVRKELEPYSATLVAVSKTKPVEMIQAFYDAGQRIFGENRALELRDKAAILPTDIEWHAIGHLQTNKVKYIAPFVHLIHAVDSLRLLEEIDKQAARHERRIDCLLQFKIAAEESKYGLDGTTAEELLGSEAYGVLENIRIVGVMGMATFTDDLEQVRMEFQKLKQYFDQLKGQFFAQKEHFKEISMGMSGDYQVALEEGSTMVRIGSMLFGARS
ncbi:MAG: YggS family pyridoxal phosphate-dependent enzyme [Bacteroidota bacterium]